MRLQKSKKAIEMSINIIVMLVIGLTVLGLVIGFVTNLLNNASSGFDDRLSAAEDAERQVALDAAGVFAVNPTSVTVNRGDTRRVFVKFKNTDAAGDLTIAPVASGSIDAANDANGVMKFAMTDIVGTCTTNAVPADVRWAGTVVSPGEETVIPVTIIVPNECNAGDNFQVTLQTKLADSVKTQFVEINVGE
ncbi:MAG: hypothetical protein VX028_04225 [Nanoarchaeota archaeon]|nr:hypothetical protein [Nanoarchaeota archaeon]